MVGHLHRSTIERFRTKSLQAYRSVQFSFTVDSMLRSDWWITHSSIRPGGHGYLIHPLTGGMESALCSRGSRQPRCFPEMNGPACLQLWEPLRRAVLHFHLKGEVSQSHLIVRNQIHY